MPNRLRGALALAAFGGAFAQPNWLYWSDFLIYPFLVTLLFVNYCDGAGWLALALLGVVLFTFVEYWAHRSLLHRFFYHGQHERHHTHPREYVVLPVYMVPAVFFLVWLILPLPVFTGFVAGYVWFIAWHDILHHADLTKWPRPVQRYALWHLAHHHLDDCNFGITVPFWDFVFRTYRPSN